MVADIFVFSNHNASMRAMRDGQNPRALINGGATSCRAIVQMRASVNLCQSAFVVDGLHRMRPTYQPLNKNSLPTTTTNYDVLEQSTTFAGAVLTAEIAFCLSMWAGARRSMPTVKIVPMPWFIAGADELAEIAPSFRISTTFCFMKFGTNIMKCAYVINITTATTTTTTTTSSKLPTK
jgi:hypothetical protein